MVSIMQCTSLQMLRIIASKNHFFAHHSITHLNFLLLAITPTRPLDVVIVYNKKYLSHKYSLAGPNTKIIDECAECALANLGRFKTLGRLHKKSNFKLVLCAEVPGSMKDWAMRVLEQYVNAHKDGELGHLFSGSSITYAMPSL